MAPHQIAFCITDLEPGGAERCLVELATRLNRERFEATMFCLASPPADAKMGLVETLHRTGIPAKFLCLKKSRQALAAVRRLCDAFCEDRPDLVQTFLFHANVVGAMAARRAGIAPVIGGIRVADPRSRLRWRLERKLTRNVDRYVCVSRSVADFAVRKMKLPADKLCVIPNGVDIERFQAARPLDLVELGVAEGRRVVTYIGRLDRQKGLGDLLAVAPQVLAKLPNHDLLFVGDGPQRGRLEQTARALGDAGRIHFAGWRNDVAEILAASDLVVLPSAWEGMPNVILEAMASGKPVVARDVEGVREVLGATDLHQIVACDDVDALAERVVALAADETLRARLGEQNCTRAGRESTWERMVAAYEELYLAALGHREK